jgi:hypothetical protein
MGRQLQKLWMSAVLQDILEDAATVPANWKLGECGKMNLREQKR